MEDIGLIVVEAITCVVDTTVTVGMAWLMINHHKIASIQQENRANAERLVKAELASHTTPLQNSIDNLAREISSIHRRLDDGDGDFEKLGERDQSAELRLERIFGEMKVFMANTFSTRLDLEKHQEKVDKQFVSMNEKSALLATDVAVIKAEVKKHG